MSKERAKGTAWETACVDYLRTAFPTAKRTGSANYGGGDIDLHPSYIIECKSVQRIDLAAIVDQAETAAKRNAADFACAWIKRRGKTSPAEGYVVMSGAQLLWLLSALIEVDEDGTP